MVFRGIFADIFHPQRFSRQARWLFAALWLKQFGQSWVLIVLPYTLLRTAGRLVPALTMLIAFFLTLQLSRLIANVLAAPLQRTATIQLATAAGLMVSALGFSGLALAPTSGVSLAGAAVLLGLGEGLGAAALWSALAAEMRLDKVLARPSIMVFELRLAVTLAPLLGILAATSFTLAAPLWIAAACLLSAALCVLMVPAFRTSHTWSLLSWVRTQSPRTFLATIMGAEPLMERMVYATFWPVFLVTTLRNAVLAGYIITSASLLATLLLFLSGEVTNHQRPTRITHYRALVTRLLWVARAVLHTSPLGLVAIDTLDRLHDSHHHTHILPALFGQARRASTLAWFQEREFLATLLSVFVTTVALALSWTPWLWLGLLCLLLAVSIQKHQHPFYSV